MTIKILLLLSWIASSLIEGCRDAHYFHDKMSATNPDKQNIHWLFTMERAIIWLLITKLFYISSNILCTGVFSLSLIFIFSFFHNGFYYVTRHKLDNNIYPKGWFDSSTTSESFLEFNVTARIFMVATGLFGIITTLIM